MFSTLLFLHASPLLIDCQQMALILWREESGTEAKPATYNLNNKK
jgi:hypothetical protein